MKKIITVLASAICLMFSFSAVYASTDENTAIKEELSNERSTNGQYCNDAGSFTTYRSGSFTIPSGVTGKIYLRVNRVSGNESVAFNLARNGGYYLSETISVDTNIIYRNIPSGTYSYSLIGGSSSVYAYSILVTN